MPDLKSRPRRAAPAADDSHLESDSAVRVLRQFRLVFNAVKTHFRKVENQAGIGGAQLWALSLIAGDPDIGVNELARAMDIHQTTASNLVKALVSLEFIATTKDEADRRVVRLRVKPAGSRILRKAPGPFTGVLPDALAKLDPVVLQRLEQDLAQLLVALETDTRAARIPLAQM